MHRSLLNSMAALKSLSGNRLTSGDLPDFLILLREVLYSDWYLGSLRILVKTGRIDEAELESLDRALRRTLVSGFSLLSSDSRLDVKTRAWAKGKQDEIKDNKSLAWRFSFGFEMARVSAAGLTHRLYADWVGYRKSNRAMIDLIETTIPVPVLPSLAQEVSAPAPIVAVSKEVTAVNSGSKVELPKSSLLEGIYPDGSSEEVPPDNRRAQGQKYDGRGAGRYSQGDKAMSPRERVRALEAKIREGRQRGSLSSSKPPGSLTKDQRESIQRRMSGGD